MPFLNPTARKLRQAAGHKSRTFAEDVQTSQNHLLNAEAGIRAASIELAHRIANKLGVSVNDILAETDRQDGAA